jgi:ribosomal protein S18 acetylase RimI-like enzyme
MRGSDTAQPIIRELMQADIPVIARWMVEIPLWQRYGITVEQAESMFTRALQSGDWLFTADVGPQATTQTTNRGFAWCMPGGAFGRGAYLRLIGVHPEWAGAGLGSALLAHVEAAAHPRFRDIFLLVSDFNVEAQRFYQRHGYQQVGALAGFVLPDVIECIYWKRNPA